NLAHEPDSGLIAMPDSFNMAHGQTIIAFADQYRLPAMYYFPLFAVDGGLISYGPHYTDIFRRTADCVDRILKVPRPGELPGHLPVQQPTSFRLVINLKAAKALGLNVPTALLAGADEVIQ